MFFESRGEKNKTKQNPPLLPKGRELGGSKKKKKRTYQISLLLVMLQTCLYFSKIIFILESENSLRPASIS